MNAGAAKAAVMSDTIRTVSLVKEATAIRHYQKLDHPNRSPSTMFSG
jgi:hypothetical protein